MAQIINSLSSPNPQLPPLPGFQAEPIFQSTRQQEAPIQNIDLVDNPYLEQILAHGQLADPANFLGWPPLDVADETQSLEALRRYANQDPLRRYYSWAIPNDRALERLRNIGPLLELGAGGGYWASLLRKHSADIVAVDRNPPPTDGIRISGWSWKLWSDVLQMPALDAIKEFDNRAVVFCWPSPVSAHCWAADALAAYKGSTVVLIGEPGGCTGSDAFHRFLHQEFRLTERVEIPCWLTVHDAMFIYQR